MAVTTKNRAAGVLATKNRLYRGEREREKEPACRPPTTILLSGQRKKDEENFNKSRRALNYSSPGRRRSSAHAERPIVSPRRLFTRPRVVRGLTFF